VKFHDDDPPTRPLAKPDVTCVIGGFPLWGRPANGEIFTQRNDPMALIIGPAGNAFSGAPTAGVAALMLSANPDLCPWEVKALMEKTCRGTDLEMRAIIDREDGATRGGRARFEAIGACGHAARHAVKCAE
jgi:hypothetical protein